MTSRLVLDSRDSFDISSYSRGLQFPGRCSVKAGHRSQGVESTSEGCQLSVQDVGHSCCGSVCFHPQQKDSEFLFTPSLSTCSCSGRLYSQLGKFFNSYAFPPIVILNRVIAKIRREQARAILIAPNWPQRSWFSQLLYMLVEVPLQLPLWPDLLSQFRICHDNPAKLSLVAWKISGVPSEAEAFRRRLRRQLCRQESPQLGLFTMQGGPNSVIGVVEGVSIPLWPLFQ